MRAVAESYAVLSRVIPGRTQLRCRAASANAIGYEHHGLLNTHAHACIRIDSLFGCWSYFYAARCVGLDTVPRTRQFGLESNENTAFFHAEFDSGRPCRFLQGNVQHHDRVRSDIQSPQKTLALLTTC